MNDKQIESITGIVFLFAIFITIIGCLDLYYLKSLHQKNTTKFNKLNSTDSISTIR
jgi:hypothetical protein